MLDPDFSSTSLILVVWTFCNGDFIEGSGFLSPETSDFEIDYEETISKDYNSFSISSMPFSTVVVFLILNLIDILIFYFRF